MKGTFRLLIVLCALTCSLSAQTGPADSIPLPEPENHDLVVDQLMQYHDSGQYDMEIREVANAARDYLEQFLKGAPKQDKLAAVFDIDETALSNWQAIADCGFCAYSVQTKLYSDANDPAIVPVLELFNYAKRNGIAVFFLTGRRAEERDSTIKNLNQVGYAGWIDLIMRADDDKSPARIFKSEQRQEIENKGYRIILNIGDQASDLAGCCAERVYKLPNPFYLVQ